MSFSKGFKDSGQTAGHIDYLPSFFGFQRSARKIVFPVAGPFFYVLVSTYVVAPDLGRDVAPVAHLVQVDVSPKCFRASSMVTPRVPAPSRMAFSSSRV
jgi:hypothetical protein